MLNEWSNDDTKDFPVIMISGHATIETAIEATKLRASDFIEKPISIEKLLNTTDSIFSKKAENEKEDILTYIIKNSKKFSDIFESVVKQELGDKTVILLGEDGTQKEGWSEYLHYNRQKSYRKI